jgi:hypothetical protein
MASGPRWSNQKQQCQEPTLDVGYHEFGGPKLLFSVTIGDKDREKSWWDSSIPGSFMRSFESLTEKEILALAISLEEEDARIYDNFADGLKENHPSQAEQFQRLRQDEDGIAIGCSNCSEAGSEITFH